MQDIRVGYTSKAARTSECDVKRVWWNYFSYIILQEAKTESSAIAMYQSNSHCGWVCRVRSLRIGAHGFM